MNLVTATEVTGLIIGVGGAGTVLVKGVNALRRLGHFIDKLAGNGDSEPGVLKRLEDLKGDADELKSMGESRDEQLAELTAAVTSMGHKIDRHVDGEAQTWLADGQAWGQRLDAAVADHDSRIAVLESTRPGTDPVTGSNT